MTSPFTPEQITQLEQPIDRKKVAHREGGGGKTLSYLEGHEAIDAANRCFGHGNWGFEIIGEPARDHYTDQSGEIKAMWYTAKVRLHVRGCEPIEEIGLVEVQIPQAGKEKNFGQQVDVAMKGSVTDALKRALRCYGDQFGNSLYDKTLVDGQEKPANTGTQPPRQQPTSQATRPVQTQQPARPTPVPAPAQNAPQKPPRPFADLPQRTVTDPPIQAVATKPAPTKPVSVVEVIGEATYGCPKCDGPIELIRGVGTSTDPNEKYTGERCASKGCGYKMKYAA